MIKKALGTLGILFIAKKFVSPIVGQVVGIGSGAIKQL